MRKRWLLLVLPAALGLALEPLPAGAADPPSGSIDAKNKVVEWTGPMDVVGLNPTNNFVADEPICGPLPAGVLTCDVFELTVNIPETGYTTSGGVNVSITCTGGTLSDYDLFVYDEGGALIGSSTTGPAACNEAVILPRASGVYMVQVNPWLVVNDQYSGVAEAFGLAKPKPKKKPKKK